MGSSKSLYKPKVNLYKVHLVRFPPPCDNHVNQDTKNHRELPKNRPTGGQSLPGRLGDFVSPVWSDFRGVTGQSAFYHARGETERIPCVFFSLSLVGTSGIPSSVRLRFIESLHRLISGCFGDISVQKRIYSMQRS